jgi:MATE family multidrug resistance protein
MSDAGRRSLPTLGHSTESRTILNIAVPLTAAYIAEMAMIITDMVIVGRLGSNELAAVGLAGDLFWIVLLIGMGVISIIGVFAAQSHGAGDRAGTIRAGEQGMVAATLTAVPVMACVWMLEPLLRHADQDPEVVRLIGEYARILVWAVPPALWFVALRNYATALARSAAIGWIMVAAVAVNFALNHTLVYGRFGFPALGVTGAGIGTTLVNWGMFACLAAALGRDPRLIHYRVRLVPRRVEWALLRKLFRLGVPVALTQMVSGAMFSCAAVLVGSISASTLAAQQIVYSVLYLALSAAGGLGDAVRVRVAFRIGRADVSAARASARIALGMAIAATLLASCCLWLAPEPLVSIFLDTDSTKNREVLSIALNLSAAAGLFLLLDGVQMVLANTLRGLRDTRSPLWIALTGYWGLGLGSGTVLCFVLDFGARGLWWGLAAGVLLCDLLLLRQLERRFRRVELEGRDTPIATANAAVHHAGRQARERP